MRLLLCHCEDQQIVACIRVDLRIQARVVHDVAEGLNVLHSKS